MSKIAIIGSTCDDKAKYLETCCLPQFYMEDFTILGFTVSKLTTACSLLQQAGYRLNDKGCGAEIEISSPGQIAAIQDILYEAGMRAELGDIADTMYQA